MEKIRFTYLLAIFLLIPFFSNASFVTKKSAEQVAKNYYFEQTGINSLNIEFEEAIQKLVNNESFYYIFNVKDNKGFVIVSAENKYFPIIGYSDKGKFISDNQPSNINWWMNHYVNQIKYLKDNKIGDNQDIINLWKKYNVPFTNFTITHNNGKSVEPLVGDILWNQDQGWNEMCPEDGAGPGGHVYVGCVATAMGIVMKYWEYPIHGTGYNAYYHGTYGIQEVNFGESTYFWNNMDNVTANDFSAQLLYHLGVSVNMGYGADGSGAYSFNVDDALEDYFQYSTDVQYVVRDGYYTQSEWISMLKAQIDAGKPVYYSGRDSENGGHAFVCSGYNNSDYFHFNFGWSGYNNGYYSVSDVGGFYNDQAAVIDIHPENSNSYPEAPNSVSCLLDNSDVNTFKVDIEWEAPITKDVSAYHLYRNFDHIAELTPSEFTYTDYPDAGNYYYSVSAEYSTGDESLTVTDNLQGLFNVTFYAEDPDNGNNITSASVIFNDETLPTTFVGAVFSDVPYGGEKYYSISHMNYPTTSGYIDVTENTTLHVIMDGSSNVNDIISVSDFELYPNPVNNNLFFKLNNFRENFTYEIIDISGKSVMIENIYSEKVLINTKELNSGYYILKINIGNSILSKSFIKN